jgi:Xaa-Pro aminopeptidase
MSDTSESTTTDSNTNRRQPFPQGFLDTIGTGWADRADETRSSRADAS